MAIHDYGTAQKYEAKNSQALTFNVTSKMKQFISKILRSNHWYYQYPGMLGIF